MLQMILWRLAGDNRGLLVGPSPVPIIDRCIHHKSIIGRWPPGGAWSTWDAGMLKSNNNNNNNSNNSEDDHLTNDAK